MMKPQVVLDLKPDLESRTKEPGWLAFQHTVDKLGALRVSGLSPGIGLALLRIARVGFPTG